MKTEGEYLSFFECEAPILPTSWATDPGVAPVVRDMAETLAIGKSDWDSETLRMGFPSNGSSIATFGSEENFAVGTVGVFDPVAVGTGGLLCSLLLR